MFNPIRFIRRALDRRAERLTEDLLAAEDRLLTERLKQHRLRNKQRKAREAMGHSAISHPGYKFNARHSNDDAIYTHFRAQYLETVRDAAELARSDNPAHCLHAARLAQQ